MTATKICSTCKIPKPLTDFYKHSRSNDGLKWQCKTCHGQTCIKTRNAEVHRDKNRLWMRDSGYSSRPEVKARDRLKIRSHPDRVQARAKLNNAVRSGKIVKPIKCENCNGSALKITAHHDDYSQPLVVRWLCTECHGREHRKA